VSDKKLQLPLPPKPTFLNARRRRSSRCYWFWKAHL